MLITVITVNAIVVSDTAVTLVSISMTVYAVSLSIAVCEIIAVHTVQYVGMSTISV